MPVELPTALVLLKPRCGAVLRRAHICTVELVLFGMAAYQNSVEVTLIVPEWRQLQYAQTSLGVGKPCIGLISVCRKNIFNFSYDFFVVLRIASS